jgi:predicted amidohydrolase YtcJ
MCMVLGKTVYNQMRGSDERLAAVHPEHPAYKYSAEEARELQRRMNSLGSDGVQQEKVYMKQHEAKVESGAEVSSAQENEYQRLLKRKRKRSADSSTAGATALLTSEHEVLCTLVCSQWYTVCCMYA